MKKNHFLYILVLTPLFVVLIPTLYIIWGWYLKPDPPIENLVGFSRTEVIQWLSENGRLSYLDTDHPYFNKIEIEIGGACLYFNTPEEIMNNSYVMHAEKWVAGFQRVFGGRMFSYDLFFKDNKVISQKAYSYRSL